MDANVAAADASRLREAGVALQRGEGPQAAAARTLEVTFFMQLLSVMRKTIPDGGLPRSPERDVYEGAFDREVAESLARNDPLGLVRALGTADPARAGGVALKVLEQAADTTNGQPLPRAKPEPAGRPER